MKFAAASEFLGLFGRLPD